MDTGRGAGRDTGRDMGMGVTNSLFLPRGLTIVRDGWGQKDVGHDRDSGSNSDSDSD